MCWCVWRTTRCHFSMRCDEETGLNKGQGVKGGLIERGFCPQRCFSQLYFPTSCLCSGCLVERNCLKVTLAVLADALL